MAGETPDRHHPDPVVDPVHAARSLALGKPASQGDDLGERLGMEEYAEVALGIAGGAAPVDLAQALRDGAEIRRRESWPDQQPAQRIDVVAGDAPTHQRR